MSIREKFRTDLDHDFGELLVERRVDGSPTVALLEAAAEARILPDGDDSVLYDHLDADSLDALLSDRSASTRLNGVVIVELWDHVTIITPSAVRIYR